MRLYRPQRVASPAGLFILFLCLLLTGGSFVFAATLTDLPSGNLYTPYILSFFEGHIITGDLRTGKEDRKFRPLDPIARSEMAKITALTRLAEKYSAQEDWSSYSELAFVDTTENKLKPYYKCTASSCSSIGGIPFVDVAEKDPNCFEKNIATGGSCEPWYTQYVYYAVSYGYIKGYESKSGGARYFSPQDSILRIHALKMAIAENGNTELGSDARYTRLNAEARARRAYAPVCLRGAETYILKNNGNDKKLLAYALLADRLDLFGKNCEVFGKAEGPQARADFLQKPVTRQEVPRYLSLTTLYHAVEVDSDPTIATAEENKVLGKDDETYVSPAGPDVDPETLFDLNRPKAEIAIVPTVKAPVPKPKVPTVSPEEIMDSGIPPKQTISLSASTVLCSLAGCETFKKGTEIETLSVLSNPNVTGKYVQNISANGQLYTVDCEVIKSAECLKMLTKTPIAKPKPAVISVTPSLITAIGKECKGSKQICDLLKQTLTGKSLNPDLFANCTTDACRAKKITDTFVPLLTFLNTIKTLDSKQVLTSLSPYLPETPEKNSIPKKIDREYFAKGLDHRGKNLELAFKIKIHENGNGLKTDSYHSDTNRNTYILIHGWNSNDTVWAADMGREIAKKDLQAQILLMDWHEIASHSLKDESAGDSAFKIRRFSEAPFSISRWTRPMVREIVQPLADWGIVSGRTTILGHSLGGFIAKELANELEKKASGTMARIILDPAASLIDYKIDFEGNRLSSFEEKGACYVADGSLSGSETLMGTCKEKYLIKYNDPYNYSGVSDFAREVTAEFIGNNLVVKIYRIVEGQKKLLDELKEEAEDFILKNTACSKIPDQVFLSPACAAVASVTIDRMIHAFVTEHNWTHKTFTEIIRNPFLNAYLTPGNITSAIGYSKDIYQSNIYKGADGVIYTEKNEPSLIKYLKVIDKNNSDYYTLYGNNIVNRFECKEDKDCILHSGSGNDAFLTDEYSNDYVIKDFRQSKSSDQITIKGNGSNAGLNSVEYEVMKSGMIKLTATCGDCEATGKEKDSIFRNIYLEGVTEKEVVGWVKSAKSSIGLDPKDQEKIPIIIK